MKNNNLTGGDSNAIHQWKMAFRVNLDLVLYRLMLALGLSVLKSYSLVKINGIVTNAKNTGIYIRN